MFVKPRSNRICSRCRRKVAYSRFLSRTLEHTARGRLVPLPELSRMVPVTVARRDRLRYTIVGVRDTEHLALRRLLIDEVGPGGIACPWLAECVSGHVDARADEGEGG